REQPRERGARVAAPVGLGRELARERVDPLVEAELLGPERDAADDGRAPGVGPAAAGRKHVARLAEIALQPLCAPPAPEAAALDAHAPRQAGLELAREHLDAATEIRPVGA